MRIMQHRSSPEVDPSTELADIRCIIGDSILQRLVQLVQWTPFDTTTKAGRSKERYRRVALTTITSVGVKGLAAFTGLISVPLMLGYLGAERYGLWMTISSIVAMLGFADLGMGNGLLNAIAVADGRNDRESVQKLASSAFFLLSGTAILIATTFACAYRWVRWPGLFNVTTELARNESGPALLALAACFIVNLPLGVVQRIRVGYQEGFVSDLWQGAGSVSSLAAVILGIHLEFGLPALVLAISAVPIVATLLNGVFLFARSRPWLLPRWRNFHLAFAKTLAKDGFLFLLLQICGVISFSTDNLIVAQVLGASAVPRYAITQKVFILVAVVQSASLAPLWPAYREAIHRGDHAWVGLAFRRSIVTAVVVTGLFSGLLVAISRPLFRAWVGPDLIPTWPLIIGFALWAVAQAASTAIAMYLNACNALRLELILSVAFIVIATPLKIALCRLGGSTGVVWGALIGLVLTVLVPYIAILPKLLLENAETRTI